MRRRARRLRSTSCCAGWPSNCEDAMERISSSKTFFMKRILPAMWLGIVAISLVVGVATGTWRKEPVIVIQPLVMAAFGYFLFRKLVWDLADEVRDAGTHLLVRKGDI